MRIKVKFHGFMKKLCPDTYEFEADTVFEALKAASTQLADKLSMKCGRRWICTVDGYEDRDSIYSTPKSDTLEVYPTFAPSGGSRNGMAWWQIAIGVLVIAITAYFTGGASVAWAGMFYGMGASMVIGGIMQLLVKTPKSDTGGDGELKSSKYFGVNKNTTDIGTRIPLGYGKYRVYGQLLSLNLMSTNRASLAAELAIIKKYGG